MNKQTFQVRFKKPWSWDQKVVTVQASSVKNAVRIAQKQAPKWQMLDVKQA